MRVFNLVFSRKDIWPFLRLNGSNKLHVRSFVTIRKGLQQPGFAGGWQFQPHALHFSSKRRGMKKQENQRFWEVDLVALLQLWWSDISAFLVTVLMFCALSLPVVIPSLIMWYMLAHNISFESTP
jgi:hypothetical protein